MKNKAVTDKIQIQPGRNKPATGTRKAVGEKPYIL